MPKGVGDWKRGSPEKAVRNAAMLAFRRQVPKPTYAAVGAEFGVCGETARKICRREAARLAGPEVSLP